MTQLSDGDLVVEDYYNLNNNGFGTLYRMPVDPPPGTPRVLQRVPRRQPADRRRPSAAASRYPFRMPFTPRGMYSLTPFTHGNDEAAPVGAGGVRVGKFTHPSAAPRQRPARRLDAGPGERPRPPDDACRATTPASTSIKDGDVDRRARASWC